MSISGSIPPWPSSDPEHGRIRLRTFTNQDAGMAIDLSRDPYVPTVGSLPPHATHEEALAWIERQRQRHREGAGFSFSIADLETDRSVGNIGLWIRELDAGRAQVGYGVAPSERGHRIASDALCALTSFAWTIPSLHRLELYIEPWNGASVRTAERAGYEREGLLRSHQEISGERCDMFLYAAIRESKVC
jgi:RimJ/RimL family protein N-acetyltransferase